MLLSYSAASAECEIGDSSLNQRLGRIPRIRRIGRIGRIGIDLYQANPKRDTEKTIRALRKTL